MSVIPVLTAGFGEGHNAAARSIIEALGRKPGLTGELLPEVAMMKYIRSES